MIILRIIEKFLIIYFVSYFLIDLLLYVIFIFSAFKTKKRTIKNFSHDDYSVSIIVPAYNEEVTITDCIEMLNQLDYENYELIIINDGSTDGTLNILLEKYPHVRFNHENGNTVINTKTIRGIWRVEGLNLLILDKENGGKADAINAGINTSTKKYICTVDADSILDKGALTKVMEQFITYPETFVSGGQLASANEVILKDNKVYSLKMPKNIWILWQIVEYIKSFLISRVGLGKFNSLLVMSGAFSVFKKDDLLAVGGYLSAQNDHTYILQTVGKKRKTLCEDMEIVVRLWRYYHEQKRKTKAIFLPQPVCWTEMPENPRNLYKQRVRWHTGLAESLFFHLDMLFDPKFKATGLFAMPYYFFFELFSPIVKVLALIFIIWGSVIGLLNTSWLIMLIISTTLITAVITSTMTVITEYWSYKQDAVNREALRFRSLSDWLILMGSSILGDFSYSFYRTYAQLIGLIHFSIKKSTWNKFERKGVKHYENQKFKFTKH